MAFFKTSGTAIAFGSVVLIIISSMGATALSTWKETVTDFSNGQRVNLKIGPDGLSLEHIDKVNERWTLMSPGTPCSHAFPPSLSAYDPANKRLVLLTGDTSIDETWTYDFTSGNWDRRNCQMPRTYGKHSAMAYDVSHGVMVLFTANGTGETWTYDVGRNVWTNMSPPDPPSVFSRESMVYDTARGQMMLFGASTYSYSPANQTWAYSLSLNRWTKKNPASAPAGYYHALAYDNRTGMVLAFGRFGETVNDTETWTYDALSDVWTNITPTHSPSMRDYQTLAYDTATSEVVLFGGTRDFAYMGDTWAFNMDSHDWTERFPECRPSPRAFHSMAYNTDTFQTVIWGGAGDLPFNGTLWAYDGRLDNWTDLTSKEHPSCRALFSMAYDRAAGEVVLFGGYDVYSFAMGDTYAYNLSTNTWRNMRPARSPPIQRDCKMVYDDSSRRIVLFGGTPLSTWTYDLQNNTWSLEYNGISPKVSDGFAMAYDSARGTVVLVGRGEHDQFQTWTCKIGKENWTYMSTSGSPPAYTRAEMVYDAAAKEMVLFDGRNTWTYNQSTNAWKNRIPGNAAPSMTGFSMVYDGKNDLIILFGGRDDWYAVLDETWTYNQSSNLWMNVETVVVPPGRYTHSMVYADREMEVILFGGLKDEIHNPYLTGDTWALKLNGTRDIGVYTSLPFDTGGTAYFGGIGWSSRTAPDTSIKLRLRTATTVNDLTKSFFTGPDGTERTYYESSGQAINTAHNASRWVQYRAVLQSKDPSISPILKDVNINYNLLHTINITSPRGGFNWTGIHNITWSANDPDNDPISFDIFQESDSSSIMLASDLPAGTIHWSWNTDATPNDIYHIRITARDDNPSIPLAINATSGDFRIQHPPAQLNHPPHVSLVSPLNNTYLTINNPRLQWIGSDPDGDPLTYTVRYSDRPLYQGTVLTNITAVDHRDLSNLSDNKTYFWTVDASDGKSNSTDVPADIWSFTVKLPPGNIPVRFTGIPPTLAWVGKEYAYNITSVDEDGDIPFYSVITGPSNISLNLTTGKLRWTPTRSDIGDHLMILQVTDNRGSIDQQIFTVTVLDTIIPSPSAPRCTIGSPANGSRTVGTLQLRGTAVNGSLPLSAVFVRIDGGVWLKAVGRDNWVLAVDISKLPSGKHRAEARAFDGSLYSDTASVDFTVLKPEPGVTLGGDPLCIPAAIVAVTAAVSILLLLKKKKQGRN